MQRLLYMCYVIVGVKYAILYLYVSVQVSGNGDIWMTLKKEITQYKFSDSLFDTLVSIYTLT